MPRKLIYALLVIGVAAIIAILVIVSLVQLNSRETGLLSLLLAILSIAATSVAAFLSSERSKRDALAQVDAANQEKFKTYALKAAEKVLNLSNELSRLSVFLEEIFENQDESDLRLRTQLIEEKISGAIHILATLKSVNDRALSDWEGVIGEELSQRREEEEEREEGVRELLERTESLLKQQSETVRHTQEGSEGLRREIRGIQLQLRQVLASASEYPLLKRRPNFTEIRKIEVPCPNCDGLVPIKLTRHGRVRYKGMACPHCDTRIISKPDKDGNAVFELRKTISETFPCPRCGEARVVELDNIIGSQVTVRCDSCSCQIRVSRSGKGLVVSALNAQDPKVFDPDLIEKVREKLPSQPWPTGIHKTIASELGIPNVQVAKVIHHLIKEGKVFDQKDGQIIKSKEVD